MQDQYVVAAATPAPNVTRFVVKSSDVISDMRVNVSEEHSEQVVWYKERFLSDEEIVEHVVHNPSSTICWTIHRPKRGWYIRLRAPSFPPGVFIPLLPLPHDSPHRVAAALSFSCRTNIPRPDASHGPGMPSTSSVSLNSDADSDRTLADGSNSVTVHSYPPTPPVAATVRPPSLSFVDVKLSNLSTRLQPPSAPYISHFVLAPHSSPHIPTTENSSFLTRVVSAVKNHKPSHSSSFTIGLLPSVSSMSPPPPYLGIAQSDSDPAPPVAFITFHDRTPLLSVHAITGLLEIDQGTTHLLGVQASFWIAVALIYLEFLQEREGYLAAVSD